MNRRNNIVFDSTAEFIALKKVADNSTLYHTAIIRISAGDTLSVEDHLFSTLTEDLYKTITNTMVMSVH